MKKKLNIKPKAGDGVITKNLTPLQKDSLDMYNYFLLQKQLEGYKKLPPRSGFDNFMQSLVGGDEFTFGWGRDDKFERAKKQSLDVLKDPALKLKRAQQEKNIQKQDEETAKNNPNAYWGNKNLSLEERNRINAQLYQKADSLVRNNPNIAFTNPWNSPDIQHRTIEPVGQYKGIAGDTEFPKPSFYDALMKEEQKRNQPPAQKVAPIIKPAPDNKPITKPAPVVTAPPDTMKVPQYSKIVNGQRVTISKEEYDKMVKGQQATPTGKTIKQDGRVIQVQKYGGTIGMGTVPMMMFEHGGKFGSYDNRDTGYYEQGGYIWQTTPHMKHGGMPAYGQSFPEANWWGYRSSGPSQFTLPYQLDIKLPPPPEREGPIPTYRNEINSTDYDAAMFKAGGRVRMKFRGENHEIYQDGDAVYVNHPETRPGKDKGKWKKFNATKEVGAKTIGQAEHAIEEWHNANPGEYEFGGNVTTGQWAILDEGENDLPEAGSGYKVVRSSERKGKTHKVTGPDGTVKFFGDSKLGQHPKDPERKKAFYARHKKNLDGNPYFRAFARKTWEYGGEVTEDDIPMAKNGENIAPFYKDEEDKKRYQQALTDLYYGELNRNRGSVLPYLAKDRTKIFDKEKNEQVSNTRNTCIDGVCGIMEKAGKYWNSGDVNRHYIGNQTFFDNAYGSYNPSTKQKKSPTEDVYQTTGNFQVGDIVQDGYQADDRFIPSDAKVIVAIEEDSDGNKIFHTSGGSGSESLGGSSYTEDHLRDLVKKKQRVVTRPGYQLDKEKLLAERNNNASPEDLKAIEEREKLWDWERNSGNLNWAYSLRDDAPDVNTDNKYVNAFMRFANDPILVEGLARKLNVSMSDVHDELLNTFGELGQESKFGEATTPETILERVLPGFIRKDLSIGPGQIRFSTLDPDLKKKLDIKKPKDLYNPDKLIPIMTGINLLNRAYLKRKGDTLGEDLAGVPGVNYKNIRGGIGRWTPYMYQSPKITGPKDYARRKLTDKNWIFNPTDEEVEEYYNENPRYFKRVMDPDSYASQVAGYIDRNLKRENMKGTSEFNPIELMEPVITPSSTKQPYTEKEPLPEQSVPTMEFGKGGMIKRKDGSYSRRGLWDNIRANKGSGKKPTKEMLEQERKIKMKENKAGMGMRLDLNPLPVMPARSAGNGASLIDLHLPKYQDRRTQNLYATPYMFGLSPAKDVNVYGAGASFGVNFLDRGRNTFGATGNVNNTAVSYPGGFEVSSDPYRSLGLRYVHRFQKGGAIPKAQTGTQPGYSWSTQQAPSYQPTFQGNYANSQTTGNRALTSKEMQALKVYGEKRVQEQKEAEYAARQARIKESIAAQNQPLSAENIMTQTQSTGDKMSFAMSTPFGNPKNYPVLSGYMEGLDYINPGKFIGDMASGLGAVPYNVQQGNYGQAAIGVAAPLITGALAGIGTQGTRQFVNNLVNPVAGINFRKGAKQIPGSGVASSVDDVGRNLTQAPKPAWQMEELPGLHLKSTMEGQAISKIVEPKTGLINVEQALGIIGKESGGADKVAMIRKGLGDNIPKKMDFNDFRKTVQDQLIPLERQFATDRSNYGIGSLGYPSPKRSSFETALSNIDNDITNLNKQIEITSSPIKKHYGQGLNGEHVYSYTDKYGIQYYPTEAGAIAGQERSLADLNESLNNAISNRTNNLSKVQELPLENQTLILGNKSKFGKGSSAHGNPEETLGHIHFLRDAETPDVLTVTQIQSDAFQGTHRIMPKNALDVSKVEKSLQRMQELQERNKSVLNKMKTEGVDEAGLPVQQYQIKQFEDIVQAQEAANLMKKGEVENFTQKSLLDKNHQERYLQELVDYAGKRGDVNKVRVPTSETAAKVQGYNKIPTERPQNFEGYWDINTSGNYSSEHQTILKKYSEQPKTIKKLFGEEPKIVTDSKGNTWYEFDIPKKFKEGKGEIKALSAVGVVGTGAATQTKNEPYRNGGKIKPKSSNWEILPKAQGGKQMGYSWSTNTAQAPTQQVVGSAENTQTSKPAIQPFQKGYVNPKIMTSQTGEEGLGDDIGGMMVMTALAPGSLPFRASSRLGRVALAAGELANPVSGFRGIKPKFALQNADPIITNQTKGFNVEYDGLLDFQKKADFEPYRFDNKNWYDESDFVDPTDYLKNKPTIINPEDRAISELTTKASFGERPLITQKDLWTPEEFKRFNSYGIEPRSTDFVEIPKKDLRLKTRMPEPMYNEGLPAEVRNLKQLENESNWVNKVNDRDFVTEMRRTNGYDLDLEDIKKLSDEKLAIIAKNIKETMLEKAIQSKNKFLKNPKYTGLKAYQEITPNKFGGKISLKNQSQGWQILD